MTENGRNDAGWLPDPVNRHHFRWWNGSAWTDHVSSGGGSQAIDPIEPHRSSPPGAAPVHRPTVMPAPTPPSMPQHPQGVETPNFNLPGGGAWAAPQQIVISNASKSPGIAISSMVLGIGAFFFSLIPVLGWLSIPFAVAGVALGIAGISRARNGFEGLGLSITGVVAAVAALIVSALWFFAVGKAVNDDTRIRPELRDGYCDVTRLFEDPDC